MVDKSTQSKPRGGRRVGFVLRSTASLIALSCCFGLATLSAASAAETIKSALASAYQWNPKLDAARATLRATDEQVAIANSGYRPTLSATASAGTVNTRSETTAGTVSQSETHPHGYGVTAVQQLFKGGQVVNTVRAAEAQVRAGRETLRAVEQQVLLDSSTSFLDVIRDQAIVKLRENNVRILTEDRKQTRERFAVGEVTRTDVAQSEATLAAAVSALDLARSNLQTSRSNFERNIGHAPMSLVEPRPVDNLLPKTINEAIEISARENPNVVAALYTEQQARHTIDQIYGQLLPSANLTAQYQRQYETSTGLASQDSKSVVANVTVPLYTGGLVDAQVRQAKQTHISRLQQIEQARTETKQTVVAAWSQLIAARAQLVSDNAQVASAQTALAGVREEERVGQRTLLDVLNAEQVLLNAQVAAVSDKHNIAVAAYAVLAAMGRLNISELGGVEKVYDAEQHYHEIRRQWWGISITRADGRVETHDLWESHGRRVSEQEDSKSWKPLK